MPCFLTCDECLEANPNIATEPSISARIAGYYWHQKNLNPLADNNDLQSFQEITRRINGGFNGLSDRLQHWDWMKKVLKC